LDLITKYLNNIAYKFPKGYPDMNNDQDVLLLESLISEVIGEKFSLEEVKTSSTEDLHEIFTALFTSGHEYDINNFENIDWEKEVNNSKLRNKNAHISTIKKYINDGIKPNSNYKKLYTDAYNIANSISSNLGYNIPIESERVFSDGKKIKADIIIYQPNRDKEGLGVSLKYGKGQFNSLSPNSVLKNLFGLDNLQAPTEENPKVDGILSQVTKGNKDAEGKINMGVKAYVNFVLDNYQDIKGDGKKTQEYLNDSKGRDFKSILDKIKKAGTIPIKKIGEIPIKDLTWDLWRKSESDVQKAFSKAYNAQPLSTLSSTEYLPKKAEAINTVMKNYIESESGITLGDEIDGGSDEGQQIKKFLATILGSTENSYYYVGEGGKKFTFIPSIKRLDSIEYKIIPKYNETSGNFIIDLIVYGKSPEGEWTELFSTDVNLRFSGDGGQFTSDISQKGSTFNIGKTGDEININKLFGYN